MTATTATRDGHAEQMDRMYRFQRHIYDLTRKYYLLGRDDCMRQMNVRDGQSVLELGCGTGRNLRQLARIYPGARLHGLDISEEMLTSARTGLARDDIRNAVLVRADATEFTPSQFGSDGFDHVLISYALSMIPDWQKCVETAIASLAPGGTLHVVDFGQQEHLPGWFRSMLQAWLTQFHVKLRPDLEEAIGNAASRAGAKWSFRKLYRGYAYSATITRVD